MPNHVTEPKIIIRPANRNDLGAIGDLWVELMTFHAELDGRFAIPNSGRENYIRYIERALRDKNYRVIVADKGLVIGYTVAYIAQNPPIFPQPHYGFIADLCVTRHDRQKGAGRLLVKSVRDWFLQRKINNVQLNVAYHNSVSQAFWRKMGCTDYLLHMWMPLMIPMEGEEG